MLHSTQDLRNKLNNFQILPKDRMVSFDIKSHYRYTNVPIVDTMKAILAPEMLHNIFWAQASQPS